MIHQEAANQRNVCRPPISFFCFVVTTVGRPPCRYIELTAWSLPAPRSGPFATGVDKAPSPILKVQHHPSPISTTNRTSCLRVDRRQVFFQDQEHIAAFPSRVLDRIAQRGLEHEKRFLEEIKRRWSSYHRNRAGRCTTVLRPDRPRTGRHGRINAHRYPFDLSGCTL